METKTSASTSSANQQTEQTAIRALAALAHTMRLRIFRALVQAGLQGLQPGALAVLLDVPASSLSFHLKELSNAQLTQVEQQGRNLIYRANFSAMGQLLGFLTENCCAADANLNAAKVSASLQCCDEAVQTS